jgi:hypothetical protein
VVTSIGEKNMIKKYILYVFTLAVVSSFFFALFSVFEWKGLGLACLLTTLLVLIVHKFLRFRYKFDELTNIKRYHIKSGVLIGVFILIIFLFNIYSYFFGGPWGLMEIMILLALSFFGCLIYNLSISFSCGLYCFHINKKIKLITIFDGGILFILIPILLYSD